MNIYARYFDQETLATSFEELLDFLTEIPEIPVTNDLIEAVRSYMESPMPYPKRYKVRPRVYFILIKTAAQTMEEFKSYRDAESDFEEIATPKPEFKERGEGGQFGWYEAALTFKRVVLIPGTDKCQYVNTTFSAFIKAGSAIECYQRIKTYLENSKEVDARSQIPSAKSHYFKCEFLGRNVTTNGEELAGEEMEQANDALPEDL